MDIHYFKGILLLYYPRDHIKQGEHRHFVLGTDLLTRTNTFAFGGLTCKQSMPYIYTMNF